MTDPIAIVGIGCRFPRASGPEALWRALLDGVDAIDEAPRERWDMDALYGADPEAPERMATRWGGFVEDLDGFDHDFFGIPAREAERADPQQRLVLEVAWEALEDAGVPPSSIRGSRTGVFVGTSTYDHGSFLDRVPDDPYNGTGGSLSIVANRLSYCLAAHGPSMAVDTACSSSLVATHLACESLRSGQSSLALAGGVNAILNPRVTANFGKAGILAPDGRCKPFDHRANGYVRSEGAGIVVLKRASDAVADGDRIYALLAATALNHNGRSNGLVSPNGVAQQELLHAAYEASGIDRRDVAYVEAHGTGTSLGDLIEISALAAVLGTGRPRERSLRVGSVKSNLGHLEAAAGVAGLIKTALALHHGELPPTIHLERPNPLLRLDEQPIEIQAERSPWPRYCEPRIAGVTSAGFGGANAHAVLCAASVANEPAEDEGAVGPQLVPVSARSEPALRARAAQWAAAIREGEAASGLARLAHTAAMRRDHLNHRAAIVASTPAEAADVLDALASGRRDPRLAAARRVQRSAPRPVFVFPGQGSQWQGMGLRLAAVEPAFREALVACDAAIERVTGRHVWDGDRGFVLEATADVQPALFATQVALASLWRAWGVEPRAVIGHSLGEVAAAHVAGALELDDAARVACERSRMLQEISGAGRMLLVELELNEARQIVRERPNSVAVAASNGPGTTVLSGERSAIGELHARLEEEGVFAREVAVDFAAHSPQVEPLQPRLEAALATVVPGNAPIRFYSTVTGRLIDGAALGARYWARNLRMPVLFAPAVARALDEGYDTFIEVAPHPVLARAIAEVGADGDRDCVVVPSLHRDEDEPVTALRSLGELYALGVGVDWSARHPRPARPVRLPTYPWQRRRFALACARPPTAETAPESRGAAGGRLLGEPVVLASDPGLRVLPLRVAPGDAPYLGDHRVAGVPVIPAALWLSAVATAARRGALGPPVRVEDVAFEAPCVQGEHDGARAVQLTLRPGPAAGGPFTIASCSPGGPSVVHATGVVAVGAEGADRPPRLSLAELRARCARPLPIPNHYAALAARGLQYGGAFRGIVELRAGDGEAIGRVEIAADALSTHADASLHPALLDACLQVIAAAAGPAAPAGELPLPAGVGRVWDLGGPSLRQAWCHARVRSVGNSELIADVSVVDEHGAPRWVADGFELRLAGVDGRASGGALHEIRWLPPREGHGVVDTWRSQRWLVLSDGADVGREVARELERRGAGCTVGDGAGAHGAGLDRLVREAASGPEPLRGIVDLRGIRPGAGAIVPPDGALLRPALGVVEVTRALAGIEYPDEPPRLWVVTSGAHGAEGSAMEPAQAAAAAVARCVANERSELGVSIVDLPSPFERSALAELVDVLGSERPMPQLALRDGRRLLPRLVPITDAPHVPRMRADGTYLVTGAFGALGRQVVRRLIERGARYLVLVGRRPPAGEAAGDIEGMRAAGVHACVVSCDVADAAALERALAALERPLAGVVHAAGILEPGTADAVDDAALRRALAPKALGAWNLHRLTADRPLDFFVLFSSLAGVLGSPGQAAYAAANACLDALAAHRVAAGLPATSIIWGAWSRAGLAVEAEGFERLAERGLPPLEPERALELFERALGAGRAHVVAAAVDKERLAAAGAGPVARQLVEDLEGGGPAAAARGAAAEEVLAYPPGRQRLHAMRTRLAESVAAVLRVPTDEVDRRAPLQEFGFDSLMAIELRDRLEAGMDLRLPVSMLFAHPSVDDFAEAILERLERRDEGAGAKTEPPARADGEPDGAGTPLAQLSDEALTTLLDAEVRAAGDND